MESPNSGESSPYEPKQRNEDSGHFVNLLQYHQNELMPFQEEEKKQEIHSDNSFEESVKSFYGRKPDYHQVQREAFEKFTSILDKDFKNLNPCDVELLLWSVTDSDMYSRENFDEAAFPLTERMRYEMMKSLGSSIKVRDVVNIQIAKDLSERYTVKNFKGKNAPVQKQGSYARLFVVLNIFCPLAYHKLAQAFYSQTRGGEGHFNTRGMRFGKFLKNYDKKKPCGRIARALVSQVKVLSELAQLQFHFDPMVFHSDFTFPTSRDEILSFKSNRTMLTFSIDVPEVFLDTLMATVRTFIETGLYFEYFIKKSFVYQVYSYDFPEFVVKKAV